MAAEDRAWVKGADPRSDLAVLAIEAVEKWKYEPGTVDGVPVAVAATVLPPGSASAGSGGG